MGQTYSTLNALLLANTIYVIVFTSQTSHDSNDPDDPGNPRTQPQTDASVIPGVQPNHKSVDPDSTGPHTRPGDSFHTQPVSGERLPELHSDEAIIPGVPRIHSVTSSSSRTPLIYHLECRASTVNDGRIFGEEQPLPQSELSRATSPIDPGLMDQPNDLPFSFKNSFGSHPEYLSDEDQESPLKAAMRKDSDTTITTESSGNTLGRTQHDLPASSHEDRGRSMSRASDNTYSSQSTATASTASNPVLPGSLPQDVEPDQPLTSLKNVAPEIRNPESVSTLRRADGASTAFVESADPYVTSRESVLDSRPKSVTIASNGDWGSRLSTVRQADSNPDLLKATSIEQPLPRTSLAGIFRSIPRDTNSRSSAAHSDGEFVRDPQSERVMTASDRAPILSMRDPGSLESTISKPQSVGSGQAIPDKHAYGSYDTHTRPVIANPDKASTLHEQIGTTTRGSAAHATEYRASGKSAFNPQSGTVRPASDIPDRISSTMKEQQSPGSSISKTGENAYGSVPHRSSQQCESKQLFHHIVSIKYLHQKFLHSNRYHL